MLFSSVFFVLVTLYILPLQACEKTFLETEQLIWPSSQKLFKRFKSNNSDEAGGAVLNYPIETLNLPKRAINRLKYQGIYDLKSLLSKTAEELLSKKRLGEKTLHEIRTQLSQYGLYLTGEGKWVPSQEQKEEIQKSYPDTGIMSVLIQTITSLRISQSVESRLKQQGIFYIGELVLKTEEDILEGKNFGQKSLFEVKKRLFQIGVVLKKE